MKTKGSAAIIGIIFALVVIVGIGFVVLGGEDGSTTKVLVNGSGTGGGTSGGTSGEDSCDPDTYQGGMNIIGTTTYNGKEVCQREGNGVVDYMVIPYSEQESWQIVNQGGYTIETHSYPSGGQRCQDRECISGCTAEQAAALAQTACF